MGAVKAGTSSNLMSLLVENRTDIIKKMAEENTLPDSKISSIASEFLDYLKYDEAVSRYGKSGVKRFYRSLFSSASYMTYVPKAEDSPGSAAMPSKLEEVIANDTDSGEEHTKGSLFRALGWVAFPAKVFSKIYDVVLRKSGSHLLAYGAGIVGMFETVELSLLIGGSAYVSYTYNIPFLPYLTYSALYAAPVLIGGGLLYSIVGPASIAGLTAIERRKYPVNKVRKRHIEKDIKSLSKDFYNLIGDYKGKLTNSTETDITLSELNALYMMVSSCRSQENTDDRSAIKEHDKSIIGSIERALGGKRISHRSIVHMCPSGVGGVTLVFPTSVMGKFTGKYVLGPVFVNKRRLRAGPSYDFAVAHELAHAAGAASEPLANFYAVKALDDMAEIFPKEGYDIYTAVNRLCFAVGALAEKLNDEEKLIKAMNRLNVPRFVFNALSGSFDPSASPLPPIEAVLEKGSEAKFARLYVSSSYVASKLVTEGRIKGLY